MLCAKGATGKESTPMFQYLGGEGRQNNKEASSEDSIAERSTIHHSNPCRSWWLRNLRLMWNAGFKNGIEGRLEKVEKQMEGNGVARRWWVFGQWYNNRLDRYLKGKCGFRCGLCCWMTGDKKGHGVSNKELRQLIGHLIVAARILSALKWKSEKHPSKEEWLQKVQYVCLMDKISAWLSRRQVGKLFKRWWEPFISFCKNVNPYGKVREQIWKLCKWTGHD